MSAGALDAHLVVQRGRMRLDAALAAAPGERIAVMGPSGAGKSTLLAAIAGLVPVASGHVRIDGVEIAGTHPVPPHRRGVVLLGQDPRLFPHLTAAENIAFGVQAHGANRATALSTARDWLARVGLPGIDHSRPSRLSGGQQQRVALARALATRPRILLLDEPITALDPETAADIRTLLAAQLTESGVTAVIVTHDALDAVALAERLVILEDGRVTQQAPVREVLAAPATRFAAAVAGTNRLLGVADGTGWVAAGDTRVVLYSRDAASQQAASAAGEGLAAFVHPGAVELEAAAEPASDTDPLPGEWHTRILRLAHTPGGVRIHTAEPPLVVDVPLQVVTDAGLAPGVPVRLRVPADAVRFARLEPAADATPDAAADPATDAEPDKPGGIPRAWG